MKGIRDVHASMCNRSMLQGEGSWAQDACAQPPQVTMRATSQLMMRMQPHALKAKIFCQRLENVLQLFFHMLHEYPAFYNMVTQF